MNNQTARLLPQIVGKLIDCISTRDCLKDSPAPYTDQEARDILGRCVAPRVLTEAYDANRDAIRTEVEAALPAALLRQRQEYQPAE